MGKNCNIGILNFFSIIAFREEKKKTAPYKEASPNSRPSCGGAFFTFWFFYVKKRREKICINQSLPFFITLCPSGVAQGVADLDAGRRRMK
jgi:hypothetical protein